MSFDQLNRVVPKSEQDYINSDSAKPLGAGEAQDMAPVTMSLSKCLEAASMKEVMKDQNAY